MTFAGLMPAHLGGGFHRFELRLVNEGDGAALVLRWRRVFEGDDETNETILIERITGARFTYFGGVEGDAGPDWQADWDKRPELPALVRLAIDFPDGDRRFWPDLVVAPRIDARAAGIE
jgi:general secretion pathway protein J